jgi:hypothetical protein
LGTPVCIQIAEREGFEVEKVVDVVEDVICETYGRSSISAKMQAIVFKAHFP